MELKIFENEQFGLIRTVMRDEEPWFVGKDVAAALGYAKPENAIAAHVDDEDKGVTKMMTPGGNQQVVIINESGVYALIFGSKLPAAKEFKSWVTHDVLPSIRKTGGYNDKLAIAKLLASCKLKGAVTAICDLYGIGGTRGAEIGGSDDDRVLAEFVRANGDNICARQACEVYMQYHQFCLERACTPLTKNMFGRRMHTQHGLTTRTKRDGRGNPSRYYQLEVE